MTTETFDCKCNSVNHIIRFNLDVDDPQDKELWISFFLYTYQGFFHRLWIAIKYLFGCRCEHGHWDTILIKPEDVNKLSVLLNKYKNS